MKLLSADEFRVSAKDGRRVDATVLRLATGPAMEVNGETRTLRFCFSDGSVDRCGDTIDPAGWMLAEFKRNPIALFSHMSWEPPIGRAKNVGITAHRLMGDIEFAPPEMYPFADTIYRLAKGGFINATSVGFVPIEWSFSTDKGRVNGIDFKKQQLLEISVVPCPANANALVEARAKGIDTRPLRDWAERVLDGEGTARIPKIELERLRIAAREAPAPAVHVMSAKKLAQAWVAAEKLRERGSRIGASQ